MITHKSNQAFDKSAFTNSHKKRTYILEKVVLLMTIVSHRRKTESMINLMVTHKPNKPQSALHLLTFIKKWLTYWEMHSFVDDHNTKCRNKQEVNDHPPNQQFNSLHEEFFHWYACINRDLHTDECSLLMITERCKKRKR